MTVLTNEKQSDHEWMIENAMSSYVQTIHKILEHVKPLEFESVLEFNAGSLGTFTGLIGLDETAKQIKNYRLMDYHHHCVIESYARNEQARTSRPDVSYVTHVGNIWEYEQIIPVAYRYRADIVIVHYLSNTPEKFMEDAIAEICRVSVGSIILVDYTPTECPIDVAGKMKTEMSEASIDIEPYTKEGGEINANECIYHVQKPPIE